MSAIRKLFAGQTHADGVQLGATGEKLGFLGAAPVVRPVGAGQAALAAATYVAPNAGALNTGDAGSDTVIGSVRTQLIALAADHAASQVLLAKIRVDLVALGLIKGAA